jgi:hypothetical protein
MVVTVPAMFGLGLSYFECLTRGTFLSPVCHVGTRACFLPLKISEIVVNNVVLAIPNKLVATPLIVNTSDTILNGFGLDDKLAASFIAQAQNSGPSLKKKIVNWLIKKL